MAVTTGTHITSNARNLAVSMRRRSKLYAEAITEATRENAETVRKQAYNFSRNRYYSLKQLRQMGHPYSRRAPMPPKPAYLINRQGGQFRAGWQVRWTRTKDGAVGTVYNRAPHAEYMMGTRKMIPRPILDEAMRRTKRERDRNIKRARDRAYQRNRRAL